MNVHNELTADEIAVLNALRLHAGSMMEIWPASPGGMWRPTDIWDAGWQLERGPNAMPFSKFCGHLSSLALKGFYMRFDDETPGHVLIE